MPIEVLSWLSIQEGEDAVPDGAQEAGAGVQRVRGAFRTLVDLYMAIQEQSGEGIFVFDPESGAILEANRAFRSFLGYAPEEVLNLTLFDIVARDRAALEQDLARLQTEGHLSAGEVRYRRKDGTLAIVKENVGQLTHGGRRVVLAIAHDLTARRQVEAERDRLAEILEVTPDLVGIADLEGREIYRNRAMRELRGPVDVELGRAVWELHPAWAARKVLEEGLPTALREGIWRGETAFLDPDGREIPTSQLIQTHRDQAGEPAFLSTVARDITEQKQAFRDLGDLVKRLQDLRHAVDESTILAITDARGIILEVNDRFCRVSGFAREELVGKTHRLINSDFHPKSFFKQMWDTILAGRVWRGEVRNRARDGTIFWADSTVVPWLDGSGKPERFFVLRILTTERKLVEEACQRRERQLELLASASRELNQDLDLFVVMRRLVETGIKLTGATSGTYGLLENRRVRLREFVHDGRWESVDLVFEPGRGLPGWAAATGKSYLSAEATGDPRVLKEPIRRLGLRSLVAIPILDRKGDLLGYFGIHNKAKGPFSEEDQSLLEALAAHAAVALENTGLVVALRQSENKYRTLVDQLHEGLALTDTLGHVIFTNPCLCGMLGYQEGEMAGVDLSILTSTVGPGSPEPQPASEGRGVHEARLPRKDGTQVEVLVSDSPLQDEAGTTLGNLVLITDNTEHKQAEDLLRQAQKGESLARMAGGIAHDFNNLFQALQSNLELVQAQLQDPGRLAVTLERTLQTLAKASVLSGKMLEYSGKGFVRSEGVDLGELIRRHEALLRGAGAGCALSFTLPDAGAEVAGDPQQLIAVLDILVRNAVEASGQGPVVVKVSAGLRNLRTEDLAEGHWPEPFREGEYVELAVIDQGCGIPSSLLSKVFDPFFSTKAPGRGLGLSSVLGLVRAHHAGLQVISAPGRGTEVRIFFPPREGRAKSVPVLPHGNASATVGKTILLVDDDEALRTTLQELLETILGYTVLAAQDGLDGLEVFQNDPDRVDLILMDATMPRMNGMEAFERIKEIRPRARALLCSGFSETLGREEARGHGFLGFLKKPFSLKELRETVEKALAG